MLKTTLAAAALAVTGAAAHSATIAEIAAGDDRFETLVAAASAAGLVETLAGPGPFTVFAPTDDAFAALPEGLVASLLEPENREQLTSILLYHVDDRELTASMLPEDSIYIRPVLTSARLCVTRAGTAVTIGDSTGELANVIIADIQADNGVIHVIDRVLIPGERPDCH